MSNDLLLKIAHKFHCEHCNYVTSNNYDYNKHIMTLKHKTIIQTATFSTFINQKVASNIATYKCSVCNYISKNKSNYEKHLLTDKHITPSVKKNETNSLFFTDKSPTKRNYEDALRPKFLSGRCNKITGEHKNTKQICCQCNKEYSNYNSLWKHKKHCVVITQGEPEPLQNTFIPGNVITPELFMEVLNESKELRNVLIEQTKELQNQLLEQNNKLLEKDNILIEQNNKLIELASKQTKVLNH